MGKDVQNKQAVTMPAGEQLAVETINRLIGDGYSSSVMKLKRPTLNELGRRLVTPGQEIKDAAEQWLKDQGHDIPRTNVYRFAQRFREVFKLVWAQWADKVLMTQLAADPAFDTDAIVNMTRNRLHHLVGQEMMTTSPADLSTKRINAIIRSIRLADINSHETESLALARDQAEHRALKLQAEIDKLQLDTQHKQMRIKEQVKGLQKQIDELSKRAERGQEIPQQIFDKIRAELGGVAA